MPAAAERARLLRGVVVLSEREALAIWYGGQPASLALRAWALVYRLGIGVRRALYAARVLRTRRLAVPVAIVGNLTAGGTGKTPLVIALVRALRARGFKPGVISRGYGGSARGVLRVDAGSDTALVGDEARLIFDATEVPLWVGRDRVAAGQALLAASDVDVVIADDGLQHFRLARDVEICVIDGLRRFGNGRLLPAGPLREPLQRLARIPFRVCNGGIPQPGETLMTLHGEVAIALVDGTQRALSEWRGTRVHGVAGIGNPARFFAQLRAAGMDVIEHAFGDHHAFAPSDLEFGDDSPVLMTAKDAVKCRAFARVQHWCVPVRAELAPEFFDALAAQLRAGRTAAA